jgi:hypothetical protein
MLHRRWLGLNECIAAWHRAQKRRARRQPTHNLRNLLSMYRHLRIRLPLNFPPMIFLLITALIASAAIRLGFQMRRLQSWALMNWHRKMQTPSAHQENTGLAHLPDRRAVVVRWSRISRRLCPQRHLSRIPTVETLGDSPCLFQPVLEYRSRL